MVRFIFICMGVVAVALVTLAAQGIYDGIKSTQTNIQARNEVLEDVEAVAVAETGDMTAEELNAIMPTAGDGITVDANDTFLGGFTNEAPQALRDTPATEPMVPEAVVEGIPD
jgi:hypothetical protein